MHCRHYLLALVCVAIFSSLISSVNALIKVDWTVENIYKSSLAVSSGKTNDIVANRIVNITLSQKLKGKSIGPKIRIAMDKEFIQDVAANEPVVFFFSDAEKEGKLSNGEKFIGEATVHIADKWLLLTGIPGSNFQDWRVSMVGDLKKAFPGRTAALVKMVNELNADTSTFINAFKKKPFAAGMTKRAALGVQKPAWLLADDLNGDKKPDLVVGSAGGTKVFLAEGEGYKDGTAGFGALSSGGYHAVADVNGDGKAEVLLDGAIAGSALKFELPKGTPLAAALVDANGDEKPDAVFVSADGEVRVYENSGSLDKPWAAKPAKTLWKVGAAPVFAAIGNFGDTGLPHVLAVSANGIMRYALDASGGAPADFTRLTGMDFAKVGKFAGNLKNLAAVQVSMNGEGRPDVLIFSEGQSLLLINRGLGAYFFDETVAQTISAGGKAPLMPGPSTPMARADLKGKGIDDVLVLGEDGTLYAIENGP